MSPKRFALALLFITPLAALPLAYAQAPSTTPAFDLRQRFPEIRRLLASSDYSQREAGQKQLDALTPDLLPVLSVLTDAETDPEVRARLDQRVNDLGAYVIMHPPMLSFDLKDAPIEQVCAALNKQLGDSFDVISSRVEGPFTLQGEGLSFWDMIARLNTQSPVSLLYPNAVLTSPPKYKVELAAAGQTFVHQIVDCFRVSPRFTLNGSTLNVFLNVAADPRVRVSQYSDVILDALSDQDGKAILAQTVAPSPAMSSFDRAEHSWLSTASFVVPANVTKFQELRGHVNLALAEKEQALTVDLTRPSAGIDTPGGRVTVEKMLAGHALIHFTSQGTRPASTRGLICMRVLDPQGKETQTTTIRSDSDVTLTAYANRGVPAKAELFWPDPVRTSTLRFSFKYVLPTLMNNTPIKRPEAPAAVTQSNDVAFLEKVAASVAEAAAFKPQNPLVGQGVPDIRCAAYGRLGELGTPEALAAVQRLEGKAAKSNLTPATALRGVWNYPGPGSSAVDTKPLVTVTAPDNTTYAIVNHTLFLGSPDLFLVSTKTPDAANSWSRPILMPMPNVPLGTTYRNVKLTFDDADKFTLAYTQTDQNAAQPRSITMSVADILRDSDKDGWTDIEEARLGLDPKKPDTDGDGIPDGQDPCPDYAPPKDAAKDPNLPILQRAFYAVFGFSDSRYVLAIEAPSPQIQFFGYNGPVLYNTATPSQTEPLATPRFLRVSMGIPKVNQDSAIVGISIVQGPRAGTALAVTLRKISDQWYVTNCRVTGGT